MIPVVSFVRLGGKCRHCGTRIRSVHLVAELACALVGATAFSVASTGVAVAGALFGWTLVALALLDLHHFWLPDRLTLPFAALGLVVAACGIGVPLRDSAIGATAGYLSLTSIAVAYRALRGRTGLGGGDPKLFMAVGAWVGWMMLPPVLLLASLIGLFSVALRNVRGHKVTGDARVPLGTLLAIAAWPAWLITTASTMF